MTAEIGIFNIGRIQQQRLFFGKFECHTQATERAVKVTTEASSIVVGRERRDGNVKATIKSRKMHPSSNTKKDLLGFVQDNSSSDSD